MDSLVLKKEFISKDKYFYILSMAYFLRVIIKRISLITLNILSALNKNEPQSEFDISLNQRLKLSY